MRTSAAFLLIALAAHSAAGQQPAPQASIHVRVLDSAETPLANVGLTVVQGLSRVVATGSTTPRGEATLTIAPGAEYELVARQIGYQRASRFFAATPEPMMITLHLARGVAQLGAVHVTEFSSLAAYRLGAEEIAASTRPVEDAFDAIVKLRPRIFTPAPRSKYNPCMMENVWVNGQRILYAPLNERMLAELRGKLAVDNARFNSGSKRSASPPNGVASVPLYVLDVLATIRAEHIEEINYSDCVANPVEGLHTRNSVFISLKPGIAYDTDRGSYVVPQEVALAANHARVVGVFDVTTGQPVPNVQVADSVSGAFVTTTETGTAVLAFLADGGHVLILARQGYTPLRVLVSISERDTVPLTLTLAPHR